MKTLTATEAAGSVPTMVLDAIRGECTGITRNGKLMAVVVPVETFALLEAIENAESVPPTKGGTP